MALPLNYHWGSLFVRKTTTLLTILVVAAVIGTFSWLLGFVFQLYNSLSMASDPRKLIVLQRGAISETNSGIDQESFNRLSQLTEVGQDSHSQSALISPEMMWQFQLPRVHGQGSSEAQVHVALRGVTEAAFRVHDKIRLTQGRMFGTGTPEVIVGESAAKQFRGLQVGDKIRLGYGENHDFEVVGHFSAAGGPMESEVWTYLPALQSAYNRRGLSSVALRLKSDADPGAVISKIEGPSIQLGAQREGDYWDHQAQNVKTYQGVCIALVVVMALAAVFLIANTMFATVDGRKQEIAMLRTIGFRSGHILRGFIFEAVVLALLGGALGVGLCALYLQLAGNTKDMFGKDTFTSLAFEIHLTPLVAVIALSSVAIVGALGAAFPAWRAGRTQVIAALREA
ncbi:MAG: ABC transporter permease [Deltaproteobacteria bacterium]|nr:ABC transporter permease [Deltaproteobacteria bacterium]